MSLYVYDVTFELLHVKERANGNYLRGACIDQYRAKDSVIGMNVIEEAPQLGARVKHVAQVRERPVGRDREPIPQWLPAIRSLGLQVVCDLRDRVTVHVAFVRRYIFISAAEHYRLENDPMNPLHVFAHKPNDVTDSIVIEAIH